MRAFSLYTLTWQEAGKPTLKEIAQKLNLEVTDFDPDFGTVCIDELEQTYCVMIAQEVLSKLPNNENSSGIKPSDQA